jgi:hypothetical protein
MHGIERQDGEDGFHPFRGTPLFLSLAMGLAIVLVHVFAAFLS